MNENQYRQEETSSVFPFEPTRTAWHKPTIQYSVSNRVVPAKSLDVRQ